MRRIEYYKKALYHCLLYNVHNQKEYKYVDIQTGDIMGVLYEISTKHPGYRLSYISDRPMSHIKWEWC